MENTTISKKEFALSQIAPYFKNPELCAIENGNCKYYTSDGKMCVAGKNMLNPQTFAFSTMAIWAIIEDLGETAVLKPDAVGILEKAEWKILQSIHDTIAESYGDTKAAVDALGLFTLEELQEYANNLPNE